MPSSSVDNGRIHIGSELSRKACPRTLPIRPECRVCRKTLVRLEIPQLQIIGNRADTSLLKGILHVSADTEKVGLDTDLLVGVQRFGIRAQIARRSPQAAIVRQRQRELGRRGCELLIRSPPDRNGILAWLKTYKDD